MKLAWMAAMILGISSSAFADCPRGLEGGNNFDDAAKVIQKVLGQSIHDGSISDEKKSDDPKQQIHRIIFGNAGGKVTVGISQLAADGKTWEETFKPQVTEICGAGKVLSTWLSGTKIRIANTDKGILVQAAGYAFTFKDVDAGTSAVATGGTTGH